MKTHKLIAGILSAVMLFCSVGITALADGQSDGTVTVSTPSDFTAAMDSENTQKIVLNADITIDSHLQGTNTLTVNNNNLVIDLNGKTLDRGNLDRINVGGEKKLTVTSGNGKGKITFANIGDSFFKCYSGSTITLENIDFSGSSNCYVLSGEGSSTTQTFNVSNCKFTNITSAYGIFTDNSNTQFNISDTTIDVGTTRAFQNGTYILSGNTSVNGGIAGNTKIYTGGDNVSLPEGTVSSVAPVSVTASTGKVSYYTSLAAAVSATTTDSSYTITLSDNVNGSGVVIPSGSNITLDLNGNTYTVVAPTVGSPGTETNGFQLLKDSNITIKNGTFKSSAAKILIQNYSNLTLDNVTLDGSTLDGTKPYTLSNNNGTISIKDSTIIGSPNGFAFDVCDYANYAGAFVTVENSDINGNIEVTDLNGGEMVGTLTIKSGNFTVDPTPYLESGKTAVISQKDGYLFTVGDKNNDITVATQTQVAEPTISTAEGVTIPADAVTSATSANNNADTQTVLTAAATSIANNSSIMNATEVTKAVKDLTDGNDVDVTIVVSPKINMSVTATSEIDGIKTVELEINATYDLVATTDADDIKLTGDDKNAELIKSGEKLNITKPISITIPLPDGFAAANADIYIKHVKDNGKTYIYKATVSADGKTATFVNPNGFSKFTATTKTPVAVSEYYYETLSDAVNAVANGGTIKLLSDTAEEVSVTRTVSFTLDTNGKNFTGSITAGANTTMTVDGDTYAFVYTRPSTGSGSTLLSYTVKFDTNGGSKLNSKTVKNNTAVTAPTAPTRDGYEFDGWYTDKDLTETYDFTAKVTKNITLYAGWTQVATPDVPNNTITLTIGKTATTVFGKAVENDVAPMIVNDFTMLPARFVAENLGATVEWDGENGVATITGKNVTTDEDVVIVITIDSATATVNGVDVELESPAFIENERTYTPLRFIAENLGATVDWDGDTQTVTISVER